MHCGLVAYFYSGAFEGEDVTHVEGDVNPVRDLEIISDELRLKVGSNFNLIKCSF